MRDPDVVREREGGGFCACRVIFSCGRTSRGECGDERQNVHKSAEDNIEKESTRADSRVEFPLNRLFVNDILGHPLSLSLYPPSARV